jgi:hypothetical protein
MTEAPLGRFCSEASLDLPRLRAAREQTSVRLVRRRAIMDGVGLDRDLAVIFVGSWGRHEVTPDSDNDFYVLVRGQRPEEQHPEIIERVKTALDQEESEFRAHAVAQIRGPGREQVFGSVVSLPDLVEKIGLDRDTNSNLTQRMLLVLESVAIHNDELHRDARQTVIDGYLEVPIKGRQPPRLFLNDVIRYWRTMCVDFAGKMKDREGQGWGLRNAKLRTSRKMLFASGLLPVLRCCELDSAEIPPFLVDQFRLAPADRVADAFVALKELSAGVRVFEAYERFLERLESADVRNSLNAIKSRAEADASDQFQSVARLADDVELGLLDLLFSPRLADTTRLYGIF